MFEKHEIIEILKKRFSEGTRIKLIKMDDPQAPPEGTLGTVRGVDDAGHIMVRWDNGSGLNVIYGEDVVDIIEKEEEDE